MTEEVGDLLDGEALDGAVGLLDTVDEGCGKGVAEGVETFEVFFGDSEQFPWMLIHRLQKRAIYARKYPNRAHMTSAVFLTHVFVIASELERIRQTFQPAEISFYIELFRYTCCLMAEYVRRLFQSQPHDTAVGLCYAVDQVCGEGMPLRYNNDKRKKASIQGVFLRLSLFFNSFSKVDFRRANCREKEAVKVMTKKGISFY